MLFNNLKDLILKENCINSDFCKLLLTNSINNYQNVLDKIITLFICKYIEYFNNKCDNYPVITNNYGITNYQLYFGNFDNNLFEVSNMFYKYFICIIFLDNYSKITFFEDYYIYPSQGDIVIFPSTWFFIYNITSSSNSINYFIVNNILGFYL
jgi:hypothetical protein